MEKTSENELSDKLFKQMKNQFDTIMCVRNYSLDNFTNYFNDIKETDKDRIFESLINEQIFNLKKVATPFNIGDSIINYNIIMEHFTLGDYDSNRVLDDILLKLAGCHNDISIPIDIKEIRNNYFNHRKNDKSIYQSFVWILLSIVAVTYYIQHSK